MNTKKTIHTILIIFVLLGCNDRKDFLPTNLFEYRLTNRLSGEAAKDFVNQIHFGEVTSTNSEVGFYEDKNIPAIIYVTEYESLSLAKKDFDKMTRKISPENSVFINGEYLNIKDKRIYRCFGMGQTHFVFYHKNYLFWLSVNTIGATYFLKSYLDYID